MHPYTRTALLTHALVGYEERKAEITEAIANIRATLDGKMTTAQPQPATRKRRTISPAARKRMALLMKQRWAKAKKAGRKGLG